MERAEEVLLIAEAQSGCAQATERLLRAHAGLVKQTALRYLGLAGCLTFDDLEQEGKLGLLVAIQRFDASRGNRLTTVAWQWIRQSICRAIQYQADMIRVPVYARPEQRIGSITSLDTIVGEHEVTFLHELLLAEGDLENDTLRRLTVADLPPHIAVAFARLREPHRVVMTLRYGLDGYEPLTATETADQLGISKQAVSQREQAALRMLRHWLGAPTPEAAPHQASSAAARLTEEDRAIIRQLAAEGVPPKQIARRVGKSVYRVNEVIRQGKLDV